MFSREQAHNLGRFLKSVGVDCHVEYFGENLNDCSVEISGENSANIESLQDLILIGKNRPEVLEATLP